MNELLSKLQRCGIVWIAAVLLTQMTAAAQSVLLTGKVVDTDGAPVIGAGIISMQKKTTGTTSDLDGKFSFKDSGWNGIRAVLLGRDERRCL